ncbi:MAG TPA: hypothetical protein PKO28_01340 [Bacilli bacterium]|nr:hypothetical protein [Bacilli bacterium]HPS18520.1 hypothetical protein [Bacilli bacterium]
MKKEDVSELFVWILILGGAAAYFFLVIKPQADHSFLFHQTSWFVYVLFFIAAVVVGVIINAIMYELAHVIGAKAGRYEIVSVSILGFTSIKENGKRKLRFTHFDGLTGETKILPKARAKIEPNPSCYLLFGSLFFGIEIIIIIFAFLFIKTYQPTNSFAVDWAYFILTIGIAGAAILFYNIVPFHLGSLTDGYRLRLVGSRKNRQAFNHLLYTEVTGQMSKEQEEKLFKDEKDTNFSTDINLNKAYILLSEEKFAEAEQILNEIISDEKTSRRIAANAEDQLIYINIVSKSLEEATIYCDNNVSMSKKRELSSDQSMGAIRTYILIAGLMEKSNSECMRALEKSKKSFSHVPEQRKPLERALFNKALEKVIVAHPNWEGLKDYLL